MPAPRSLEDIASIRPIIGMEVHVELATRTKVFAAAPNPAHPEWGDAPPNTLIDPVVLGLPGALPVLNAAAVEMAARVGLALNCRIAAQTKWDRKSYFYPDLPKGYQISQYDLPLCFDGVLEIPLPDERGQPDPARGTRRVAILRAHLEEDAGKLLHEAPGGRPIDFSIADYNRAGAPLLEIVTQPDLTSADEAVIFCRTLRNISRFLGATEGVLQKGHMRFEPNINCVLTLRDGHTVRTPIVEVKNLNSYRAVKGAIEAELRDQPARWVATGIEQGVGTKQTRGFDERAIGEAGGGPSRGSGAAGATVLQREKEDAHDYRYFPDPDLPVLTIPPAQIDAWAANVPELPDARARRYVQRDGLTPKDAAALVEERDDCLFFERVVELMLARRVSPSRAPKAAANLILQSGLKRANELSTSRAAQARGDAGSSAAEEDHAASSPILVSHLGITPDQVAAIGVMREDARLSAANADALFAILCEPDMRGRDAESVAEFRGMLTVRDDATLDAWCDQVIAENESIVEQIKAGKTQAIGRLVGAAMKLSAGAGDAKAIRTRLLEKMGVKE